MHFFIAELKKKIRIECTEMWIQLGSLEAIKKKQY